MKRLLRRPEVESTTGLKRSTIYAKIDPKSDSYDADFPKPVRVGSRAVAWVEAEIDEWTNARIAERDSADNPI